MNGIKAIMTGLVRKAEMHTRAGGPDTLRVVFVVETMTRPEVVVAHYDGDDAAELCRRLEQGSEVGVRGQLVIDRWDDPDLPSGLGPRVFVDYLKVISGPPKVARKIWTDEGRPVTPGREKEMRSKMPSAAAAAIPEV